MHIKRISFIDFAIHTVIVEQINFIGCCIREQPTHSKSENISATKPLVENSSDRDYWSGSASTFHASVERYSTLIVTISLFILNGGEITDASQMHAIQFAHCLHNARSRSTSPSNFAHRYTDPRYRSLLIQERRTCGEIRNCHTNQKLSRLLGKSVFHARRGSRAEPLAVDNS